MGIRRTDVHLIVLVTVMDHSHMDHGQMDHDHGDMDMGGDQCSMNMLFTWSSKNLCIVFPQWRVTGTLSLLISLIAIVILTAGYEWVRDLSRRYEQTHSAHLQAFSTSTQPEGSRINEISSLLSPGKDARSSAEQRGTIVKAAFYAVQVFYSFFIMLLFMTYNGWVMLAVAVGAFFGYLLFGAHTSATKSVACH